MKKVVFRSKTFYWIIFVLVVTSIVADFLSIVNSFRWGTCAFLGLSLAVLYFLIAKHQYVRAILVLWLALSYIVFPISGMIDIAQEQHEELDSVETYIVLGLVCILGVALIYLTFRKITFQGTKEFSSVT